MSTLFEWLTINMKHDKIRAEIQLEAVICIWNIFSAIELLVYFMLVSLLEWLLQHWKSK